MYERSAHLYDLFYDQLRDYPAEVASLIAAIERHRPQTETLLDVGCGTGKHLQLLAERFEVVGADLSSEMLEIATERNPGVALTTTDVLDMDLGRRFDAVVFLFSGIAYVQTPERLTRAVERLAAHVQPGGIVVVDSWLRPDAIDPAYFVGGELGGDDQHMAARLSRHVVEGSLSRLFFEYLTADEGGFTSLTEEHVLGLLPRSDYEQAFAAAGLDLLETLELEAFMAGRDRFVALAPS